MSFLILPLIALILLLSFLFSMLGLGGAMLYIPVLHWFSFDFKTIAIPVGLLLNGITALSASIYYLKEKMVDLRGALPLILTSALSAPLGAALTHRVRTDILILLFAISMLCAGGKMLLRTRQIAEKSLLPNRERIIFLFIGGTCIGFIAGFLGLGGGFLFVPLMLAMGYQTKIAAATSSFIVIFPSFSGLAGHISEGNFPWPMMITTSIAVIIGSQIGAKLMKERMKAHWIQKLFAVLLLGVALKLLWQSYPGSFSF